MCVRVRCVDPAGERPVAVKSRPRSPLPGVPWRRPGRKGGRALKEARGQAGSGLTFGSAGGARVPHHEAGEGPRRSTGPQREVKPAAPSQKWGSRAPGRWAKTARDGGERPDDPILPPGVEGAEWLEGWTRHWTWRPPAGGTCRLRPRGVRTGVRSRWWVVVVWTRATMERPPREGPILRARAAMAPGRGDHGGLRPTEIASRNLCPPPHR